LFGGARRVDDDFEQPNLADLKQRFNITPGQNAPVIVSKI